MNTRSAARCAVSASLPLLRMRPPTGGFAVVLLGMLTPSLSGQTPRLDTLRVSEAVETAIQANPTLQAAREGAAAAIQRIGPAGALPDPQIQFGLLNRIVSGQFYRSELTMNEFQLMQTVPWPGKQGAAHATAQHSAAAARADADEQTRMLVAQVRMRYFDVAYADRALEVMQRTRGLMRNLLDVSTTMYAVGSAVQQDVLRAQVEVGRMTEEIARMTQERIAMVARLDALLGRDATTPIAAVELPEPGGDLPEADSLIARALQTRPALQAGAERVAAAEASLSGARRQLFPDFQLGGSLGTGYFHTMGSLWIGLNVPIFAGWKQFAMRREAAAMREQSRAELLNLRNETVAQIIETRARAEQDRNLARLYRTSIVPQARAAVQTSLASYRVGQLSFMQLIDNQLTVNRYETETYRLFADYQKAVGELEALVSGPVEQQP